MNRRHLWHWVNVVFNRRDINRVKSVGPDRAAAEWILRLGGAVKFKDFDHSNSDYNLLPSGSLFLEGIDATNLSITNNGLEHLGKYVKYPAVPEGLTHLRQLSLSKCNYLYDDGLFLLHHVQLSLILLDISYCKSLTENGLRHVVSLKNLQKLNIVGVDTTDKAVLHLQSSLPQCEIIH